MSEALRRRFGAILGSRRVLSVGSKKYVRASNDGGHERWEIFTRPIVCDILSDVQRLDVDGRKKKFPTPAHQFR